MKIEHYFHHDAIYSFNETNDFLNLNPSLSNKSHPNFIESPLFTIQFFWDPLLKRIDNCMKNIINNQNYTQLLVSSIWSENENDTHGISSWINNVQKYNPILMTTASSINRNFTKRNDYIKLLNNNIYIPMNEMFLTGYDNN